MKENADTPVAVPDSVAAGAVRFGRADFFALTKARLSALVAVTTGVGFIIGAHPGINFWGLANTIIGTLLCAFGSSVFNQLMEMDADAKMQRTAGRPLPARRLPPAAAFALGWALCAWGLIHLDHTVNIEAAILAAATLVVYIFIYTPMKRRTSLNTLVGAVAGAIPPVIGWAGAAGPGGSGIRWPLMTGAPALFLFGLLFFWQLPHFVAINWMYRDDYRFGGFVMWSNDDETGAKSGALATAFSLPLVPLMLVPPTIGLTGWIFAVGAGGMGLLMVGLAIRMCRLRTRAAARRLFLFTLLYLPVVLILLVLCHR